MTRYLALLRGVNVGGKGLISMATLKEALTLAGFANTRTYINSGNVFFDTDRTGVDELVTDVEKIIRRQFGLKISVVIFTQEQWQRVIDEVPAQWGRDGGMKHNLLVPLPGTSAREIISAIGQIKPDIEAMWPGPGVVYQSLSWEKFGRTTGGKLAGNPIYKQLTVRNFNTTKKLLELFAS